MNIYTALLEHRMPFCMDVVITKYNNLRMRHSKFSLEFTLAAIFLNGVWWRNISKNVNVISCLVSFQCIFTRIVRISPVETFKVSIKFKMSSYDQNFSKMFKCYRVWCHLKIFLMYNINLRATNIWAPGILF